MLWQNDDKKSEYRVPDTIVDLLFDIRCREIPVDHAHALSLALTKVLPEIAQDERIAVHTIHVAGSQNGWERPEHSPETRLMVSRRTKFTLRVPKEHVELIKRRLEGRTLDLDGCRLTLGNAKERLLSKQGTVFSRYVACEDGEEDENAFLRRVADELAERGIQVRKALCGKSTWVHTPDGPLPTRSLMIADLKPDEAVSLQQRGIGKGREMGLGIFLPHKGIEAVKESADD